VLGIGGTVVAGGEMGRYGDDDDDPNKNKDFSLINKVEEKEQATTKEEEE